MLKAYKSGIDGLGCGILALVGALILAYWGALVTVAWYLSGLYEAPVVVKVAVAAVALMLVNSFIIRASR